MKLQLHLGSTAKSQILTRTEQKPYSHTLHILALFAFWLNEKERTNLHLDHTKKRSKCCMRKLPAGDNSSRNNYKNNNRKMFSIFHVCLFEHLAWSWQKVWASDYFTK